MSSDPRLSEVCASRRMAGHRAGPLEAFAFTALVVFDIWFLARRAPLPAAIPVPVMFWSWRRHSRTQATLGLSLHDFRAALREWWPLWMVCAALIAAVIGKRFLTLDMLHHTLNDFLWSCLQQLALQSMVYLPLREVWPRTLAALLTGLCFAAVHVPNPVLVPGTFVWGAVAALLFERRRSIWALGIAQALLSALLMALTPVSLNRGFHVGPFY